MRYLSTEWMDAARRALAVAPGLAEVTAGLDLTVEHVVTGGPAGTAQWHLRLGRGGVTLVDGPAAPADVRFTTTYDTAAAVASGEIGAQRAFAEGRLRVGGDLRALASAQRALAAVDDVLADVRAETTYTAPPPRGDDRTPRSPAAAGRPR